MRKKILSLVTGMILSGLFIWMAWMSEASWIVKGLRAISALAMVGIIIYSFRGILDSKKSTLKYSYGFLIIDSIWAISFLLANVIEKGLFKVINIFPIAVLGIGIKVFLERHKGKEKEDNAIKFGYWWVGFVLLIPLVLILVAKGY